MRDDYAEIAPWRVGVVGAFNVEGAKEAENFTAEVGCGETVNRVQCPEQVATGFWHHLPEQISLEVDVGRAAVAPPVLDLRFNVQLIGQGMSQRNIKLLNTFKVRVDQLPQVRIDGDCAGGAYLIQAADNQRGHSHLPAALDENDGSFSLQGAFHDLVAVADHIKLRTGRDHAAWPL